MAIYLDYMATTPVDPRVIEKMLSYFSRDGAFANPASGHAMGAQAKEAVEVARHEVAALIGAAHPHEIIWTSGATEAINLALKGAAQFNQRKGRHIITCQTEHKAVLDTCHYLEQTGFRVTYLAPEPNGLLDLDRLEAAFCSDTLLVSIMHVNNEIGVIQDVAAIAALTRERGILFHVDAAQSAGKIPLKVQEWGIDLLSLSAHKVYAPKGMGALYIRSRPRVRLTPQTHGGGQEKGLRPGTLPVPSIVAMGEAFRLAHLEMAEEAQSLTRLRDYFWQGLCELPGVQLNGDPLARIPANLNICFEGVENEALMMAMPELMVSVGSACNSMIQESSHVLRALGLSDAQAYSSIRFSIGRFTTLQELDEALAMIKTQVTRLRSISPLWPSGN